ncbi:hypothetical protein D3C87_2060670 [compost metagenome]
MLGMAPLLVVLREERIERNGIPREQVDWKDQQVQIYLLEFHLLQGHRQQEGQNVGSNRKIAEPNRQMSVDICDMRAVKH